MNWMQLIAAFINGILVYLIVWGLGMIRPMLNEKWPWAWTALGGILGIIIPVIANALTTLLGFPIDLSPILNVFAGVVATMFTMQKRANIKITELRKKAGLLLLIICLILASSITYAQSPRTFKGLFISPESTKKAQLDAFATQPLMTVFDNLPFNFTGDTLYRIRGGGFDVGFGIDLASYKGLLTLRAEGSQSATGDGQFAGGGIFLNIPTLCNMIGANWIPAYVNPSIGIVPGFDFNEHRYDTGIVLSIIQVTF